MRNARWGVGVAGVAMLACTSAAEETMSKDQLLEQRIDQLQSQVTQLRVEQKELREQQAEQAALAVEADRRSQLLTAEGFTSGYDANRGFVLQSGDGRFLVHPWIQMQFRGVINARDNTRDDGVGTETQTGFEMRRLYLSADGNAWSPDLKYMFIWAVDRHTGSFAQLDAWASYHLPGTAFTLKGGQFQNPLDHEGLVVSRFQLTPERSLAEDVLAGGDDYVQGVQLAYDNSDNLRIYSAFTNGFNDNNKNFQSYPVNKANFGMAGRVEYKAFGDWKEYRDFSALGDTSDLLVFGGGFDWTEAGQHDALRHVIDAQFETATGFSAFGAYLGRYTARGGLDGADTYDPSFRAQIAYLVTQKIEPYLRYDYLHLDGKELASGVHGTVNEITAGANYYIHGHQAKFTLDIGFLPTGTPVSDDASDVLATGREIKGAATTSGGGREWFMRAQFQLVL